jgi:exodeoxyribonuclease V alpha subunit
METLIATVEHVLFKADNGWTVASAMTEDGRMTNVVGVMDIRRGSKFVFSGTWGNHPKYGEQFQVVSADLPLPSDFQGALGFLDQLPHIGEVRGRQLLSQYGVEQLFEIIEKRPQDLVAIDGITPERAAEVQAGYLRLLSYREDIILLKSFGLTDGQCSKIRAYAKKYELRIKAIFDDNPYQLTAIKGFGFPTVDDFSIRYGVKLDDPNRAKEAIVYALQEAKSQGHCFMMEDDILGWVDDAYVPEHVGKEALRALTEAGTRVVEDDEKIYLKSLWDDEVGVSRSTSRLTREFGVDLGGRRIIKKEAVNFVLHAKQFNAVEMALTNNMSIVTGGPGTGKTTSLKKVIEALERMGIGRPYIACCAPTGKAAIRMRHQAGIKASTIHRLLEYSPEIDGFVHDRFNPLPVQAVIVDESSMVDIQLMACLIQAIPDNARLILVGDVDQLPPVGPGNVLGDLINSESVPVTRLTHIFRQSEHSWISVNARDIREGRRPNLDDPHSEDFFFLEHDDPEDIQDVIVDLVQNQIPERHKIVSADVQLLCPQKKKAVGVETMNHIFQETFNPETATKKEWRMGTDKVIRVGDRVIHTVNNYELMVMNGEVGVVDSIMKDDNKEYMVVDFGDREVIYTRGDAFDLQLAYALTVHKSQGSEYPAVVIPVHSINKFMLTRKLIYTAITRGKQAVYLVGQRNALFKGVNNNRDDTRSTFLSERVQEALSKEN